jgi:surface antigen
LIRPGSLRKEKWDPPPKHDGSGGDADLYPPGQCTWFVAKLRPDLPYFRGKSGDAKNWIKSAQAYKIPTGTKPRDGAVAVFEPGQYGAGYYGHVAYVTAFDAKRITVTEANYRGRPAGSKRTLPRLGVSFIYWVGDDETPPGSPTSPARTRFADATGDGLADMIAWHGPDLWIYRNRGYDAGDVFAGYDRRQVTSGFDPTRTQFADVTGDGLADMIAWHGPDLWIYRNRGYDAGDVFAGYDRRQVTSGFDPTRTQFADVTGDGLADMIAWHGPNLWIYRNRGYDAGEIFAGYDRRKVSGFQP